MPTTTWKLSNPCSGLSIGYSGKYRDDLTGQVLKDELVTKARAVELAYFHSKSVWKKVSRNVPKTSSGKSPISVRWVDMNNGDGLNPNYRWRLVARQMKAHDHSGQSFFAPAPPQEAFRTVLRLAMTAFDDHQPTNTSQLDRRMTCVLQRRNR